MEEKLEALKGKPVSDTNTVVAKLQEELNEACEILAKKKGGKLQRKKGYDHGLGEDPV